MKDSATTSIFVVLIMFWSFMAILTNMFIIETGENIDLSRSNIGDFDTESQMMQDTYDETGGSLKSMLDFAEDIPLIKYFVPLLRIMTFQYSDEVPAAFALFLNSLALLTAFVGLSMITSLRRG